MKRFIPPTVTIFLLLVIWEVVSVTGLVPAFLLPAPHKIVQTLINEAPLLMYHASYTILEAIAGLIIGIISGFLIALVMERIEFIKNALKPLITVSQTIPTIAIAPLLLLWMGYGIEPKILLVALTSFFPITVSLLQGFDSADKDIIDMMKCMGASWWQIFINVKLPASVPSFFAGLRISATYAVVGAVIAEWLGGFMGLGVYMTRVRKSYSYSKMFAVIIVISALSLILLKLVDVLEKLVMPYKKRRKGEEV